MFKVDVLQYSYSIKNKFLILSSHILVGQCHRMKMSKIRNRVGVKEIRRGSLGKS
ncbi:hypothetical protein BN1058_00971 [Paraliobacillus sp. PM-2]|nr:hypothetical protein BN1058_00971 [Paraliobacillus sp. PM-2]